MCKIIQASRRERIISGIRAQNEPAEFEGRRGFWCQGDCVFIEAASPQAAIDQYRHRLAEAHIGVTHNLGCASIREVRNRIVV